MKPCRRWCSHSILDRQPAEDAGGIATANAHTATHDPLTGCSLRCAAATTGGPGTLAAALHGEGAVVRMLKPRAEPQIGNEERPDAMADSGPAAAAASRWPLAVLLTRPRNQPTSRLAGPMVCAQPAAARASVTSEAATRA
jgi:hypothetical protein